MKKKFKLIVPSFLTLIFCLLLIAGSTFAIFSSTDDASIEVTSGKVHVTATLTDLAAFSAQADDTVTDQSANWAGEVTSGLGAGKYKYVEATEVTNSETPKFEFATKGTAELTNDKTLILNNVVPGDKVTLKLTLTNSSNVDVKYRVRLNAIEDNGLLDGLKVKVNGTELVGTIKNTAWLPFEADEIDMPLEVLLPITAGNEYQEKTAKLRFTVEMVQGNAKVDEVLDLVNGYLTSLGNTNKTMWDAIQDANAWLNTEAGQGKSFTATNYVWNMDTDQFYAEDNVVTGQGFESRFFKAYTYAQYQLGHPYAVYAVGTDWPSTLTIDHNFDQGSVNMSSIKYDRHDAAKGQEAVVRTNSTSTDLEINAPKDVVHHYGTAGTLTITAVAGQSYHENGKAAFVEIKNGRIVLEQEAKVEQIHLVATEGVFNDITVAKAEQAIMPDFSRDPVEIPAEGKLVVALQSSTNVDAEKDYVWLTAIGIYEQVTVSNSNTEAGNNYAAEITSTEQKATEQKTAAQQIANNISATVGENEYTLTATPVVENNVVTGWTYALESEEVADITENVTVEVVETVTTVSVSGIEQETVKENGLTEEKKAEAKEEAVISVVENDEQFVARIGTTGYTSLQSAMDAGANKTIVLLSNISTLCIEAAGTKSYTIDLNNNTLTLTGSSDNGSQGSAIYIDGGGWQGHTNLTLKNGTINMPGTTYNKYGIFNYGTLTLKDLTINSDCDTAVYVFGHQWGTAGTTTLENVVINSSKIAFESYAYTSSWAGTVIPSVNIKNSEFNGTKALCINGNVANVENSAFNPTSGNPGIYIGKSATSPNSDSVVTFIGSIRSNASSDYYKLQKPSWGANPTIIAKEGTYNFDPTSYVDLTKYVVSENNNLWTVKEAVAYAPVYDGGWKNIYFDSLEAALNASKASEDEDEGSLEIYLLKDLNVNLSFDLKAVGDTYSTDIYLNGHTLSGNIVLNGTTLTLHNGIVSANITLNDGLFNNETQNCALTLGNKYKLSSDVSVTGNITINGVESSLTIIGGSTAPNITNNGGEVYNEPALPTKVVLEDYDYNIEVSFDENGLVVKAIDKTSGEQLENSNIKYFNINNSENLIDSDIYYEENFDEYMELDFGESYDSSWIAITSYWGDYYFKTQYSQIMDEIEVNYIPNVGFDICPIF